MFQLGFNYDSRPIAVDDGGEALTLAALNVLSRSFSALMDKRSLVFCLCENVLGSLAGYLSFLEIGMIPIMLDAKKDVELVRGLLTHYHPQYVWSPTCLIDMFANAEVLFSFMGYTLLKTCFQSEKMEISSELALLLTTSGSTGSPKLVRLSYRNILSNAESIAEYLDITSKERPITSLPMYYSYGLSVINSHLIKGATILLTDKPVVQKEFWTFAKEQKATSISGVPYTYEMLKRLRVFRMDLPSLKTMTQAGGKLNALLAKEYIEKAEATGKRFIVMYGQTEATARMSYLPWEKALEKYKSIGIAIPGGKFYLIDGNSDEITTPETDGELIYKGDNVSLGYAECIDDLAKGDENHGVLHTGDIARRDEDGYYYITGRMKRFVKIWGNRCNLDATEQLVKSLTTNCACAGVDDKITVFVTEDGLDMQIKSFLSEKLGLNIRAFDVKVIDAIPKNPSGKVLYSELQKLLD